MSQSVGPGRPGKLRPKESRKLSFCVASPKPRGMTFAWQLGPWHNDASTTMHCHCTAQTARNPCCQNRPFCSYFFGSKRWRERNPFESNDAWRDAHFVLLPSPSHGNLKGSSLRGSSLQGSSGKIKTMKPPRFGTFPRKLLRQACRAAQSWLTILELESVLWCRWLAPWKKDCKGMETDWVRETLHDLSV